MARRIAVLVALVGLVVAAAVAWFGYVGYERIGGARAAQDRVESVASAWGSSPASVTAAKGGRGGVVPKGVAAWPQWGAVAIEGYAGSRQSATVTVRYLVGQCEKADTWVDVRAGSDVVVVLVRRVWSWNPIDRLGGLGGSGCPSVGKSQQVDVSLDAPLGKRVVVDGMTGASVARAKG